MKTTPQQQFHKQMQYATDYIQWCYYVPPVSSGLGITGGSFNVVRGHLFKMLYRYLNDPMNHDLRTQLGNGYSLQRLDQAEVLIQTLRQRYESFTDTEWEFVQSSQFPESTWYRRHRSASVFLHDRISPNNEVNNRYCNSQSVLQQHQISKNAVSIEERKLMIRKKIEHMKEQKKIRIHSHVDM